MKAKKTKEIGEKELLQVIQNSAREGEKDLTENRKIISCIMV